MAQFTNAYPLPDGNPSTLCTSIATCALNYTASFPGKSVLDSTSARVDYSLGKSMTLFGRYAHSPSSLAAGNSATINTFVDDTDVYTAGWTWAIRSSMSNDLRFNFTHSTLVTAQTPLHFGGNLSSIFPSGFAQPPASFLSNPVSMAVHIQVLPTHCFRLSRLLANNGEDQRILARPFR